MQRRFFSRRKPDAAVDWVIRKFREYLHLPDPAPVYLLLGAVAANLLEGEPVWLMLVGPPSSGKTELLNSLLGMPKVFEMANISHESAFLSATPKREKSKEATGGKLRQIEPHGALVLNDFTSVLTLEPRTRDKILSVFRECYQGRWTRDVGSEGGRTLSWQGRLALFGGVTGDIDRHHQVNSSLGERWIYCRMPEDDDAFEKSKRALQNAGKSKWRDELKHTVNAFFAGLDIGFGDGLQKRRELTDREMIRVIQMGAVGARCRSAVIRDSYGSRDIIGARETEHETRVVTVLGQLLVGMELIGVGEKERWRLLGKVALDSMPQLRRLVIEKAKAKEGTTPEELVKLIGCSRSTVDRTVEDLAVHGVVEIVKEGGKLTGRATVRLTERMKEDWRKGWGE